MEAPVKVATLSRDRQLALGNLLATLGAMGGTPPLNEFKQALATATAVFAVDEATGARLARAVQLANRHSNGKLLPGSGFDHGSAVEPMGRGRRLAVETGADGIGSVDRVDHGANVQSGAFPGFYFLLGSFESRALLHGWGDGHMRNTIRRGVVRSLRAVVLLG